LRTVATAARLSLMVIAATFAQESFAQDAEDDDSLDLFDDDVELAEGKWPRFSLSAGLMNLDADGTYRLALPDGRQVTILDFERIGLSERDSSYWLSATWRSRTNRWGAWFATWEFGTTGTRIWEDEWTTGDGRKIPVGAAVGTTFDARWYVLEATYSLLRSDRFDAGLGFGIHAVDLDTTLAARVDVGENGVEIIREELSTLAPLPNLLAYFHWRFAPRWSLSARVGWFGLDYDKYSGQMSNAHATVGYALTDRWQLAFGYDFVSLDVDVDEDQYLELYDLDFAGPVATVRFTF
jgi:hypothetical protein